MWSSSLWAPIHLIQIDAFFIIDRDDEAIIIALDIERHALGVDDARRSLEALHIGGARPTRLARFVEPGVESRLQRGLVLVSRASFDEFAQCAPGDDPHGANYQAPKMGA